MLAFGEQLYRLTLRDEETLKLEPYFRTQTVVTGVGVGTARHTYSLPQDRCLWLHSIVGLFNAEAATNWQFADSYVQDSANSLHRLEIVGASGVLATPLRFNGRYGLVLPPFSSSLTLDAIRTGTSASVNSQTWITGYLIPPGRIARG